MDGWIKIHRKMLDNPIVTKDAEHIAIWIYLLLNATHSEYPSLFKGEKIMLQPGQLITGRKVIADKLSINESKVRRVLDLFEIDQQIDRQRTNKNSLITILNWDKYQLCDQLNDQQVTNKRPTSDQQVTTYKNERSKEIKNEKNIEDNKLSSCSELENNSEPPIIQLVLNDGTFFDVTETLFKEYQEIYPAVNVMQELRNMKGWCNSNPRNRKTRNGIKRFINSWLSREQNKGGRQQSSAYMDSIKDRVNVVDSWV